MDGISYKWNLRKLQRRYQVERTEVRGESRDSLHFFIPPYRKSSGFSCET